MFICGPSESSMSPVHRHVSSVAEEVGGVGRPGDDASSRTIRIVAVLVFRVLLLCFFAVGVCIVALCPTLLL